MQKSFPKINLYQFKSEMPYYELMDYQTEITETGELLLELERSSKDLKTRDRVRFIRYLKTGKAETQKQAGVLLGIGERQAQRLWREYRERGLSEMSRNRYRGGTGKFEAARRGELEARLKKDDIQTLEQAKQVLGEEFAAHYTVGGVSYLFQRLQIKLKTGRPHNIRQAEEEREEFAKKNIRH